VRVPVADWIAPKAAELSEPIGMPSWVWLKALNSSARNCRLIRCSRKLAPVHAPGEHRRIALPPGRWTDLWTGEPIASGTHEELVPLDKIPVYLRSGALIPIGLSPDMAFGESMSKGRVSVLMVTLPSSPPRSHRLKLPGSSEATQLESHVVSDGFEVDVSHWQGLQRIEVLGLQEPIKGIRVDGRTAPESDSMQVPPSGAGWRNMGAHRVVVWLSEAKDHVVHLSTK
jgi:hypothetical protein